MSFSSSSKKQRVREIISLLERETRSFQLWCGPNSPILNSVDYKIWGKRNAAAAQTRVNEIDGLKWRMFDVLYDWEQNVINDAINEWRKRLCIRAKGEH